MGHLHADYPAQYEFTGSHCSCPSKHLSPLSSADRARGDRQQTHSTRHCRVSRIAKLWTRRDSLNIELEFSSLLGALGMYKTDLERRTKLRRNALYSSDTLSADSIQTDDSPLSFRPFCHCRPGGSIPSPLGAAYREGERPC